MSFFIWKREEFFMAGNTNLIDAARIKNDEFYTEYNVIEKEMNAFLELVI